MFQLKNVFGTIASPMLYMAPQTMGRGKSVRYPNSLYATRAIQWVSTELDGAGKPISTRLPVESTKTFRYPGNFTAMGKKYTDLEQLRVNDSDFPRLFKDIHGRTVFYTSQRFPCFDSYDYLYENRFYRWFLILGKQTITRIHYTDEQKRLFVTEDVANIEDGVWNELCQLKFYRES